MYRKTLIVLNRFNITILVPGREAPISDTFPLSSPVRLDTVQFRPLSLESFLLHLVIFIPLWHPHRWKEITPHQGEEHNQQICPVRMMQCRVLFLGYSPKRCVSHRMNAIHRLIHTFFLENSTELQNIFGSIITFKKANMRLLTVVEGKSCRIPTDNCSCS